MNLTLVAALLAQRARSLPRVVLLLAFFTLPLLVMAFARGTGLALLRSGAGFAIVIGSGLIGQDLSSGTLQLLVARPVTRTEYVLSRWLGAGLSASCLVAVQIAIGAGLMAMHGEPPAARDGAIFAGEQVLAALGTTSVLVLLSAILPGIGDILGIVGATILASALQLGAALLKAPWVGRAGVEIGRFIAPTLALGPIFGGGAVSWFEVVSYFSTVTLCVALAIVIMNRRELSNATG